MTRNNVRVRFRPTLPLGSRRHGLHAAAVLGLIVASGAGLAPCARGAGIFRGLTARDRSEPILMSQTGEAISLRSPGHAMSPGAVPAYLAFPLHGGEHFPAGTQTVATGPLPGETPVGPLDLTSTSRATLNADLLATRGAIVSSPTGSYAIAMLPRYARALAHAAPSAATGSGGASGTIDVASILGLNAPPSNWTINGVPASKLSQWFQTGTKELSHLTSLGVENVGHTLGLKVTPTNAGYRIAAQELIPPTPGHASAQQLAVPAPEPATWLIFGLILGAAGLWRRGAAAV